MEKGDTTLNLDGELGEGDLSELGEWLIKRMWAGCHRVVMDFSEVTHLDFRGVRLLLGRVAQFRDEGGEIRVAGLSRYLSAILRAAGAHDAFQCYPDATAAWASFGLSPVTSVLGKRADRQDEAN